MTIQFTNLLGPKSMLGLADDLDAGIMFGHDHPNTQDELNRAQAAGVLRWLARQMQAQEYVMGLVEDYGQWMWDSGYMDSPTGETLVDDAYHKRQEIREAMLAWKAVGSTVGGLLEAGRELPFVNAPEIDGEESDGTPRLYRSRKYVSLTKLERLLQERLK